MSGIIAGLLASTALSTVSVSGRYFENDVLLLHGDGTNGGQNNTFIDSSLNNFTITRNGNTTQGSFNPYGALWSNYFDGTGDYLNAPNNAAFDLGSSNFTIEAWVFPTAYKSGGGADTGFAIISRYTSGLGWALKIVNATTLRFVRGADVVLDATGLDIPLNSWSHVAVSRSSGNLSLFLNGTRVAAATGISNFTDTSATVQIGLTQTVNDAATGYISNLRVVKGTAVYDPTLTTLTVPTGNLTAISNTSLLTCQSNRFIDNSTNNFAITRNGDTRITNFAPFAPTSAYTAAQGASGYFDGTGDYLTAPDNAAFQFGTGDFTVEAWINLTTTVGQAYGACLIVGNNAHGVTTNWLLQIVAATRIIQFYAENPGTVQLLSTKAVNFNEWSHVAVSRTGGTLRLFLNGVQEASTADASSYKDISYPLSIGADGNGNARFGGYICDVRIVKGTAVYTGNFTPPTSPLTAITNTSLLCNFKNAAIFDSAAKNDLETVGNAQIDTTTKKFGSGSIKFDGTGDYLTLPSIPAYSFSGTFTIEFWINFTSIVTNTFTTIICGTTQNTQLFITTKSNGTGIRMGLTGILEHAAGSKTWNTGTWYHVALVRNVSSIKFYVDGIDVTDSTYTNTTTYYGDIRIGVNENATNGLNGFIDELRITNGVARYTANFTPPTQAFSDN